MTRKRRYTRKRGGRPDPFGRVGAWKRRGSTGTKARSVKAYSAWRGRTGAEKKRYKADEREYTRRDNKKEAERSARFLPHKIAARVLRTLVDSVTPKRYKHVGYKVGKITRERKSLERSGRDAAWTPHSLRHFPDAQNKF